MVVTNPSFPADVSQPRIPLGPMIVSVKMRNATVSLSSLEILESRIAPAVFAYGFNLGEIDGTNGFKLSGAGADDLAGFSVSDAGDVNGDGYSDIIVGAQGADAAGSNRGRTYIVFGKPGGFAEDIPLNSLNGADGFKLSGVADDDFSGVAVSSAGDVNGDGFDDILVATSRAGVVPGAIATFGAGGPMPESEPTGAVYVVFGKAAPFSQSFDFSDLDGSNGFMITGLSNIPYIGDFEEKGRSVGAAGDVNGDGFDDIIVGSSGADAGGTNRGEAYVVYGRPGGFEVELAVADLDGSNGFKISGVADGDAAGFAVAGVGDINADGYADIMIGAPGVNEVPGETHTGAAYVVFGQRLGPGGNIELSTLNGANGFKLSGMFSHDLAGVSGDAAGDINGDGIDDLVIGAPQYNRGEGATYVFFGKASGFAAFQELSKLNGSKGVSFNGYSGFSVSSAGDVNGDGLDDILLGTGGSAHVIFGKRNGFGGPMTPFTLDGFNGFSIYGGGIGLDVGKSVSAAGDLNGDGFDDIVVGAPGVNGSAGAAYVIYGFGTSDVSVSSNGRTATFTDWNGDLVTIRTSKGTFDRSQFRLSSPNPLTGGSHLIYADFSEASFGDEFAKANITITAKRGPNGGDGLVNVGTLDARGTALGRVSIDGDLQQVDAEGLGGLTVYSFGQFVGEDVHGGPLVSVIGGRLGDLTVKTAASRVTFAAQNFGAIKALSLNDVHIFAEGVSNPTKLADATAIKSLTVGGSVNNSQILAGYDATGSAVNADVKVGAIKVLGNWIASDLVAGIQSGDDGIFATADDELILGGTGVIASIAKITISGAVIGTPGKVTDGFGLSAEEIRGLSIGKAKVPLVAGVRNDPTPLILGVTNDVRVREFEI